MSKRYSSVTFKARAILRAVSAMGIPFLSIPLLMYEAWTVELLIALFFAVKGFTCKCSSGKVWVLDSWKYNELLRYKNAHIQSHDINILARAMLAYGWKFGEIKKILKEQFSYDTKVIKEFAWPMAFVGGFTNDRKNAQHGCFTIFGEKKDDFEAFCKNGELAYFVVNNQEEILSDLNKI